MPLASGTRLGQYSVVALLGAGGMGEVYRAHDPRLGRDVAIKVLPEELATDPARLARFEREGHVLAALNHPNILAVYDVGRAAGPGSSGEQLYVVTELLEGQTLKDALTGGPFGVAKAVDVATQVAWGLASAHEKGLVHRDLKPANVFLAAGGHVKILDFGLARTIPTGSGATETALPLTSPGVVVGTVGYMAPEQVRGQAVDARADLFALGVVLYEMLSGRPAFIRATAPESLAAILRDDPPDLAANRSDLPPALDRIVRHCLEKTPAERFQTARDVAFTLGAFTGLATTTSGAPAPARASSAGHAAWLWGAIGAALIAGAGLGALTVGTRGSTPPISFERKSWGGQWVFNARFMPDGATIVYSAVGQASGQPELFVNQPSALVAEPLGPPDAHLLSVSSKGELAVLIQPAYQAIDVFQGTLARMTLDGAPRPWVENIQGADWSPDGSTMAIVRVSNGVNSLEYPIGHSLYELTAGFLSDVRVSPDGRSVAFMEHDVAGDNRGWLKVVDLKGNVRTLGGEFAAENGVVWSHDGRSIYFSAWKPGGYEQCFLVNAFGPPRVRVAFEGPGSMHLHDGTAAGQLLVSEDDLRSSMRGRVAGSTSEQEWGWLDFSQPGQISSDHRSLLFTDSNSNAGSDYSVALREIASAKVTRLGPGAFLALSPDDTWAAAIVPSKQQIVLYPTGPGDPLVLDRGPIARYRGFVQWVSATELVTCGSKRTGRPQCYSQDIHGEPTPFTPDGVIRALLSPNGRTLFAVTDHDEREIGPVNGRSRVVPGLTATDEVVSWGADSRSLVVDRLGRPPITVERLDIDTGARTRLGELSPPDPASVVRASLTDWRDGGREYVYGYERETSQLFLVKGVLPGS